MGKGQGEGKEEKARESTRLWERGHLGDSAMGVEHLADGETNQHPVADPLQRSLVAAARNGIVPAGMHSLREAKEASEGQGMARARGLLGP